ncbi:DUF3047 domain-containing protein [Saccharospirillum impatiens]|uniref:DUF3047 domain-containing protein n=1 Tax=Saccharospirillum impatiens TaxID=169438 RepID=UPI00041FAE4B|nr:DUF3047 domain-containing protein [Saccharospirillum impatiens]
MLALYFGTLITGAVTAESLPLTDIDSWEHHSFEGESRFEWQASDQCLRMMSDGTASARIWEQEVELEDDTQLSWRWRAEQDISSVARQEKPGDDFAGRIYVAVEHPLFFWRSRVLAYVHASELPVDTHWPNPFTGQFHMWVVSNGESGNWQSIERGILDDWEVAFGDRPDHFDAIGLMADSDNSGQQTDLCLADLVVR